MKITDSPYPAGTPEHNRWVRDVFIPGAGADRWSEDAAKAGAESIGGKLVSGRPFGTWTGTWVFQDDGNLDIGSIPFRPAKAFFFQEFGDKVLWDPPDISRPQPLIEEVSGSGYDRDSSNTAWTNPIGDICATLDLLGKPSGSSRGLDDDPGQDDGSEAESDEPAVDRVVHQADHPGDSE